MGFGKMVGLATVALLQGVSLWATVSTGDVTLFDGSTAQVTLVVPERPSTPERLAAEKLIRSAKDVWGFELVMLTTGETWQTSSAIVLGTPTNNPIISSVLSKPDLAKISDEGFIIRTVKDRTGHCLVILGGKSGRGVYGAAVHLADFSIQAEGESIVVPATDISRTPAIPMRGTYNLVCWGLAPRYTLEDWKRVVDAMMDDGMNYLFFWVSGLFRSEKFPETFIYPETPMTTNHIRELARYSNERGIDFYLGSGVFAWFGVDALSQYHSEFREFEESNRRHMCRSLAEARSAMLEYLLEIHDAIPEAKGLMLEIGCEGDYHCSGKLCQTPLDKFGSKWIGHSELSFLKEFSEKLWVKHPRAKLVWLVGYPSHKWDVQYYGKIRTELRDPRYHFLEVRQSWSLPDQSGIGKSLKYFSDNMMHWDGYYRLPLRDLAERVRRTAEEELVGYSGAFEPGFSTRSIYGRQIPFPVDLIPYRLTRFVFREYSWEPEQSWGEFRRKLLARFFGRDADQALVDLLLECFSLIQNGPIQGTNGELVSSPAGISSYGQMIRPRLLEIEKKLDALETTLGPKAGKVGVVLIRTAVTDLRKAYSTN